MVADKISSTISIHAPAKGATTALISIGAAGIEFQSTLPRRERLCNPILPSFNWNFNPRSREGSDQMVQYPLLVEKQISIHAPAKGATAKTTYFFENFDFCLCNTNKFGHCFFYFTTNLTNFYHFSWCEPLCYFMFTYRPHQTNA